MRRALMVSPHFPPDSSAATHRLRLLAPHLLEFGWRPTIVTVDPRYYEGRLEPALLATVPDSVQVVRVRAWSASWTRRLRFGDLGLRAYSGLWRTCRELVRCERFHCFFVTIFPSYPALLGPMVKRVGRMPFVLDYQDPWVGSWGSSTGPGCGGKPDLKSRLSRAVAARLEPIAVRAADAITSVSAGTYEALRERIPEARSKPCVPLPMGGEPLDFDLIRSRPPGNPVFDSRDGKFHLSYVGTLLPNGIETLRSLLKALALLKVREPLMFSTLRVHFVGTSNQSVGRMAERVLPEARALGVAEVIEEIPARVDYFDALDVLVRSDAVLLLGSSERHYTASKLYPAILSRRPLVAMYHNESSVVAILGRAARPPSVRLITYDDSNRAESRVEAVYAELKSMLDAPIYDPADVRQSVLEEYSARSMAGRLASLFDDLCATQ